MATKENLQIRTEEVNEILSTPPKWIFSWGITVICSVFILIFLLAYFIRFPETIPSTVEIIKKEGLNAQYSTQLLVRASDFGKIKAGQKINIKLDDYPYTNYGFIEGTLKRISSSVSENNYLIEVELNNGLKTTFGNSLYYSGKMRGTGNITIGNINLIEKVFFKKYKLNK